MRVAYLAAIGATMLWGASFLLTKIVLTQLGPMATAALRWGVAAIALIALSMATGRGRQVLRRALSQDGWAFLGLGLVGVSLFYTLQNLALVYTTSVDVGLIMNGFPTLTAVLGVWLLGERLTRRALVGVLAALVGVTLITLGGLAGAEVTARARLVGDLLAVAATHRPGGPVWRIDADANGCLGGFHPAPVAWRVGGAVWSGTRQRCSRQLALVVRCMPAAYFSSWCLPLHYSGGFHHFGSLGAG
jgi:uncharacterized membrane protein